MKRLILAACFLCACGVPEDVVRPRTPQALMAHFSQLDVSQNAVVARYDDGFVVEHDVVKNEGGLFITLRVDSLAMKKLVTEALGHGFISIGTVPKDTIPLWYHGSPKGTQGLYRLENGTASTQNEQLIVLDTDAFEVRLMRIKTTQKW